MHDGLLDQVLETIRKGKRRQDPYDPIKSRYTHDFWNLPMSYTHNNFVLTAYLVERW